MNMDDTISLRVSGRGIDGTVRLSSEATLAQLKEEVVSLVGQNVRLICSGRILQDQAATLIEVGGSLSAIWFHIFAF